MVNKAFMDQFQVNEENRDRARLQRIPLAIFHLFIQY